MHIVGVQFDIVWEDKAANHRIVERMLRGGDVPAGSFVVLPELGDTGFSFDLERIADGATLPWARNLARELGVWLQAGHAIRGDDGLGRNCASIVAPDGTVTGTYRKVHPFTFGHELKHFRGGDRLLIRRCGDGAVCPLICYDLRFPELWRLAVRADDGAAEVFTIGASWPDARQAHWRSLLIARAIENQACVVGVNRTGADPHLSYAGGSIIISPTGAVLAEAGDEPGLVTAEVDLDALRRWRREFPALGDTRPELLGALEIDSEPAPGGRGAGPVA